MHIEEKRLKAMRYFFSHEGYGVKDFVVGNLAAMCQMIEINPEIVYRQLARNEYANVDGWTIRRESSKETYNILIDAGVEVASWVRGFDVFIPGEPKCQDQNDKKFMNLYRKFKANGESHA